MKTALRLTALTCLLAPLASACSGGGESVARRSAVLTRATSCEDLGELVKRDQIARVHQIAAELYQPSLGVPGSRGGGFDGNESGAVDNGGGGTTADPGAPSGHSETNNQVAGVDEADLVKTDGERLWLLHGQELMVITAWPPQSIGVEQSLAIEGYPFEMHVGEGKALVYSSAFLDVPSRDGRVTGGAGGGLVGDDGAPAEDPYYPTGTPFTKLTLVDLQGAVPTVERELYFEGSYTSSRRIGAQVRSVISGGFGVAPPELYDVPYGEPGTTSYRFQVRAWEQAAVAAIQRTSLADWLPRSFEANGEALVDVTPSCSDYYAPSDGSANDGITRVITLDLGGATAPSETAVLGYASQVYANHDKLILAQNEWRSGFWGSSEATSLHVFGLDQASARYEASGLVPGHLDDQFSIDERDGVVRVATTTWGDEWGDTENRVLALRAGAEHALDVVGDTGPMARGEQIFSARFVGDRGYVVTFRQTDPLFVVDLSNPEALKVLGELEIPGFSDYMHPLDDTHLVTIGRNRGEDGIEQDALALQIFDVTDATAPALTHKHVFAQAGWSTANYDHKAFSFFPERRLMAFPFSGYSERGYEASLEVFEVDATSGFEPLGAADHGDFMNCTYDTTEPCDGYAGEVRRGVFIDDYVYSISDAGILVHAVSDMQHPVASLPLPHASVDPYY
ncbi:MAG: beta-propeller domain-containing protein [Myxococcales bacterium]|nr:beta-propeller domain-containing protein [Myxococcales bacterium]